LLQRVEFRYDAFGNRIEKKVDEDGDATSDTTQRYALDGWKNVRQPLVGNEKWDACSATSMRKKRAASACFSMAFAAARIAATTGARGGVG
jgi:hypothetical protein